MVINLNEIGYVESIVADGKVQQLTAGASMFAGWVQSLSQPLEISLAHDPAGMPNLADGVSRRVRLVSEDGEILMDKEAKRIDIDFATGKIDMDFEPDDKRASSDESKREPTG